MYVVIRNICTIKVDLVSTAAASTYATGTIANLTSEIRVS